VGVFIAKISFISFPDHRLWWPVLLFFFLERVMDDNLCLCVGYESYQNINIRLYK
jgi:hypothetical protein